MITPALNLPPRDLERFDAALLRCGGQTTPALNMGAVAALIRQVQAFCLSNRGRTCRGNSYEGWPADIVFRWLAFHWYAQQLFLARKRGALVGCLVAWPTTVAEIERREAAGEPQFQWEVGRPGDAWIVGDFVTLPQDRAGTVCRLEQLATARWPDWKLRRIFTWYRGRLDESRHGALARFFSNAKPSVAA